ncbi:MAG: hypothetical protein HRU32_07640 [Rhodobacteraceae bacterium]|nr:hypothetical protein [Paracoccaceae bacterium]
MDMLTEIADQLAQSALEVAEETGDEMVVDAIAKSLGTSSTTLEEAFLTAVRYRKAQRRGNELIAKLKEQGGTGGKP